MADILWTDTALEGLNRIRSYIEQFNLRAAAQVAGSLRAAAEALAQFPHRARRVPNAAIGTRELVVDLSYIIRYRISDDTVIILRIRHAARRPTKR